MAGSRIQIASNKKAALLKQNMREIALMLSEEPPKEEKAKIRAEALIRDDNLIEAYEILQLECELLHERIKLIEYSKDCPTDLVPVVATLMWASHRVDIPELLLIRKQFRAKYGKQFEDDALRNKNSILNERVVTKLSVEPPAAYLVQTYLERICEQFEVDWTPQVKLSTNQMIEPMAAPIGYSVQVAQGTGLGAVAYVLPPGVNPNGMSYNNNNHYDDTFKGGGGGSVPPIVTAQPYIPPPPTPSSSSQQQQQQQQRQPQQQTPTSPNNNDFAEVDIFVPGVIPGAPTAPPGSVASGLTQSITGQTTKTTKQQPPPPAATSEEDKKEDDDDQDNNGGGGGGDNNDTTSNGGGGDNGGSSKTTTATTTPSKANSTTSYADLAARFQQLKK